LGESLGFRVHNRSGRHSGALTVTSAFVACCFLMKGHLRLAVPSPPSRLCLPVDVRFFPKAT
jgi:hypothetical protein